MVETFGAFARNPLYNELQVRKSVPVSAKVSCLYTPEEIREKTVKELSDGLDKAFSFDYFRWQKETGLRVEEPFRADGLEGGKPVSPEETGRLLGMTAQEVVTREAAALAKLRNG